MLTVLNALQLATGYFEKKEIPSARINAELLLSHLLNCKRLDLYLRFDQPLTENEVEEFRSMISRRGKYEPVQYIIGNTDFYGLNFLVNPSVLIPRPETEILVETIIDNHKYSGPIKILDIGSGSGNIAVSLAKNLSGSDLLSIDISEEALITAQSNAARLNVNNVQFIKTDILSNGFADDYLFDLIVSNPPYISESDYSSLQKEITLYEPKNALSDNMDGLNFYRRISRFAVEKLKPGGYLYFEMGIGQSLSVKSIMENNGFGEIKIIQDYQRIDRVIYGVKK